MLRGPSLRMPRHASVSRRSADLSRERALCRLIGEIPAGSSPPESSDSRRTTTRLKSDSGVSFTLGWWTCPCDAAGFPLGTAC